MTAALALRRCIITQRCPRKSLVSITLPDGLTSIGFGAFLGCTSLVSITLPDGLTWEKDAHERGRRVCRTMGQTIKAPEPGLMALGELLVACFALRPQALGGADGGGEAMDEEEAMEEEEEEEEPPAAPQRQQGSSSRARARGRGRGGGGRGGRGGSGSTGGDTTRSPVKKGGGGQEGGVRPAQRPVAPAGGGRPRRGAEAEGGGEAARYEEGAGARARGAASQRRCLAWRRRKSRKGGTRGSCQRAPGCSKGDDIFMTSGDVCRGL